MAWRGGAYKKLEQCWRLEGVRGLPAHPTHHASLLLLRLHLSKRKAHSPKALVRHTQRFQQYVVLAIAVRRYGPKCRTYVGLTSAVTYAQRSHVYGRIRMSTDALWVGDVLTHFVGKTCKNLTITKKPANRMQHKALLLVFTTVEV